jgi:hypothetical protein
VGLSALPWIRSFDLGDIRGIPQDLALLNLGQSIKLLRPSMLVQG